MREGSRWAWIVFGAAVGGFLAGLYLKPSYLWGPLGGCLGERQLDSPGRERPRQQDAHPHHEGEAPRA